MTRPLLLLDVDGVLNTYGRHDLPAGWSEYALFPDEEPVRHTSVAREWAARRTSPILLITADPAVGLTRGAVDRVIAWADAL
jgi:hypothetical protein